MKEKLKAAELKATKQKKGNKLPSNHLLAKSKGSKMITALTGAIASSQIAFNIPLGYNFNRNIFDEILKNKKCEGIRIYFGLNSDDALCLVITGLDSQLNDLYVPIKTSRSNAQKTSATEEDGVGDMGQACPLYPEDIVQLP